MTRSTKFTRPKNFFYLIENKKSFSNFNPKLSDINKLLSDLEKHKKELEDFKKQLEEQKEKDREEKLEKEREQKELQELAAQGKPERNFLTDSKERIDGLIDKQEEVENNIIDRIEAGYKKLRSDKAMEIFEKFEPRKDKLRGDILEKSEDLEGEFRAPLKPVAYFQKKVDLESSGFKKLTQVFEKEEEEIDKELKKEPKYKNYKEEYEKERSEWKEQHQENVRTCRKEKQEIKTHIESNLQKASEMAEDLSHETGPDYTGGDD